MWDRFFCVMVEKKEKSDEEITITEVFNRFIENYTPAATYQAAHETFSTSEIQSCIEDLTGLEVPHNFIYNLMMEAGFIYMQILPLEFKWILLNRENP